WHLLEVAVTGIGTLDGTRTVWLNGQLVRTRSGIDWTDPAMRLGLSALGQPYSGDRRFTGVVDFDDFRSSVVPHASRISLDVAPGAIQPGDCVPVAVALRDSVTGAVAPAPYDVDVDMGFSGGSGVTGGFFSDPGCSTPTLQLRVASGTTSGIVYFQPDASGSASIIGTQVDFLPATASISVQAPVPVPAPSPKIVSPGEASVACGQPWSAATEVEGEGPFTFELQPVSGGAVPEGLRLDAGTGVLSWTPTRLQAGAHRVERVVRSGSMSDVQLMELEVRCDAPPALGVGCSCAQGGSASTALTWLAGLLVLALPRARSAGLRPRS
ncbi:MAG: putative Ig domain-containing protein, partial [Myxococcaceae bacterium]